VTEAGGLVGNFTGDADFMEQSECVAGNPRIYAQLVGSLNKYSKFAGAGDKALVRQSLQDSTQAPDAAVTENQAAPVSKPKLQMKARQSKPRPSAAAGGDAPF
jgi:myo-inositol-1(or 4)-monophosphatase